MDGFKKALGMSNSVKSHLTMRGVKMTPAKFCGDSRHKKINKKN